MEFLLKGNARFSPGKLFSGDRPGRSSLRTDSSGAYVDCFFFFGFPFTPDGSAGLLLATGIGALTDVRHD